MIFLSLLALPTYADYTQELQDQIAKLKKDYPEARHEYFHDAGILVHKADDARLYDMAAGMTRKLLLEKMESYVQKEWDQINSLYALDAFEAGRRLQNLIRLEEYYKPSEEFLQTAAAQAILTERVQSRDRALESFESGCADEALLRGIEAIRMSGVFMTLSAAETESLRQLDQAVGCCVNWKPEVHFSRKELFETDYDAGMLREEAHLRLESSRTDLSHARWGGEFIYRFTGREGEGQGVSQGILNYRKGEDYASLVITTSRVTSTGRMNFPQALSGENRTLEVEGNPVNPRFRFFEYKIPATGCRDVSKNE